MNNKKQSSVDWLISQLDKYYVLSFDDLKNNEAVQQAKAMHENEIIEAWENGNHKEMRGGKYLKPLSSKYYNETFKSNET
jgi:hypothetical protein